MRFSKLLSIYGHGFHLDRRMPAKSLESAKLIREKRIQRYVFEKLSESAATRETACQSSQFPGGVSFGFLLLSTILPILPIALTSNSSSETALIATLRPNGQLAGSIAETRGTSTRIGQGLQRLPSPFPHRLCSWS